MLIFVITRRHSVGCVPATHWPYARACFLGGGCLLLCGVSASWGCLLLAGVSGPGGVCSQGVCFGGCLLLGGVCFFGGVCFLGVSASGGVSFLGECLLLGGVCFWGWGSAPGGVVSQHALRQTPPSVDRITDTTSLRPVITCNGKFHFEKRLVMTYLSPVMRCHVLQPVRWIWSKQLGSLSAKTLSSFQSFVLLCGRCLLSCHYFPRTSWPAKINIVLKFTQNRSITGKFT